MPIDYFVADEALGGWVTGQGEEVRESHSRVKISKQRTSEDKRREKTAPVSLIPPPQTQNFIEMNKQQQGTYNERKHRPQRSELTGKFCNLDLSETAAAGLPAELRGKYKNRKKKHKSVAHCDALPPINVPHAAHLICRTGKEGGHTIEQRGKALVALITEEKRKEKMQRLLEWAQVTSRQISIRSYSVPEKESAEPATVALSSCFVKRQKLARQQLKTLEKLTDILPHASSTFSIRNATRLHGSALTGVNAILQDREVRKKQHFTLKSPSEEKRANGRHSARELQSEEDGKHEKAGDHSSESEASTTESSFRLVNVKLPRFANLRQAIREAEAEPVPLVSVRPRKQRF